MGLRLHNGLWRRCKVWKSDLSLVIYGWFKLVVEVLSIHRISVLEFIIKLCLRLVIIRELTVSIDIRVILVAVVNLDVILGSDWCCLLLNQFPLHDGILYIAKSCLLILVCSRLLTTNQVPLKSKLGWWVLSFFGVLYSRWLKYI